MAKLAELLDAIRRSAGDPPRTIGLLKRSYLRIDPPGWMIDYDDDRFLRLYQDQHLLFKQGEVVWAHLVQANSNLFYPEDPDDLPAAVVCGYDRYFDDHLDDLSFIAHHLFEIKGRTMRHPQLARLAEHLQDEMEVLFNHPLPDILPTPAVAHFTCLMVHRKHLPVPYLAQPWFPLLVLPDQTPMSMILPSRYWPQELVHAWVE
jgi:hypothetical protein